MIKIIELHKSFNNKKVLDGIDLNIQKGQVLSIIGESGCGKSVLLKHIIRLLEPDSGMIRVDDVDICELNEYDLYEVRKNMGMVFQNSALFDSMTIEENIAFSLYEHTEKSDEEIEKIVKEKLEMVNLKNVEKLLPNQLSGGMKKRVGFARAIALDPEIVLYDEPTTGLDPVTSDTINKLIISANRKLKVTSIVVTHDMKSAYQISDQIAMLHNGKIIEQGTPEQIQNSRNLIVQNFINGNSEYIN